METGSLKIFNRFLLPGPWDLNSSLDTFTRDAIMRAQVLLPTEEIKYKINYCLLYVLVPIFVLSSKLNDGLSDHNNFRMILRTDFEILNNLKVVLFKKAQQNLVEGNGEISKNHPFGMLKMTSKLGATAYQLGNTSSRTITEVKQR